jgi:hypothetical protein
VDATAETGQLAVVTRPRSERGLDVALVADTSPAMTACRSAVSDLERLLWQAGAFRSVTRWTLWPGNETLLRDREGRRGTERSADTLIDPSGRRLVLVMTDATTDHWYEPVTWQTLRRWSEVMPTAVVHVLPARYRAYGPLDGSAVAMRPPQAAGPNSMAAAETAWWGTGDEATSTAPVPVPVIGLSPPELARWARAAVTGDGWVDAVWARQPPGSNPREANARLSAEDRVKAFQARASLGAQSLARVLATAPELSFPLLEALQRQVLPATRAGELAEVLVSGLLQQDTAQGTETAASRFRFRPLVSDLLRRGITVTQEWDVFEAVSQYLTQHARITDVRSLLIDPQAPEPPDRELAPFTATGRSVAALLGITYAPGREREPRQALHHDTIQPLRPWAPEQSESHAGLLSRLRLPVPTGRFDAILVSANGPVRDLRSSIGLAHTTSTPLLVMCSRRAQKEEIVAMAAQAGSTVFAVDVPSRFQLPGLSFRTSMDEEIRAASPVLGLPPDDSLKRNLGLLLARMLGWSRLMLLDEDIYGIGAAKVANLAGALDSSNVSALIPRNYPDNSVASHAHRLSGGRQDIFASAGCMGVRCDRDDLAFFPGIYKAEWLFFAGEAANRTIAYVGESRRRKNGPFDDPARAAQEEFGDLLTEGLYARLDVHLGIFPTDTSYWASFIDSRREFLNRVIDSLSRRQLADDSITRDAIISVQASLRQLQRITPSLCQKFVELWQSDLTEWRRYLNQLPQSQDLRTAIEHLGLGFSSIAT